MPNGNGMNLGGLSLNELHQRNEQLKSRVDAHSKTARGTGGAGTNKFDDDAREFSQKQIQVEGELFGRLADIHNDRSPRAQAVDEAKRADLAETPEQWADNPFRFDWPGLDTP